MNDHHLAPIHPSTHFQGIAPLAKASTPSHKGPTQTPGLLGTSTAYLVPDHIHKKFVNGWSIHVPFTFLTDKGCLLKDKSASSSTQYLLTIDNGQILTTSKPLSDEGELDLTFDEWHQAWCQLLNLIRAYIPEEFLLWKVHYNFILNNDNKAEFWPLYLAYDTKICKRATQLPINPSKLSISIWNDLETRYTAKKVLSLVQANLKSQPIPSYASRDAPRNLNCTPSFQANPHQHDKFLCGDCSKDHSSHNCSMTINTSGFPCHLLRHGPSDSRQSKPSKLYCFIWNGIFGCTQVPCSKGEHWCSLYGSKSHYTQCCTIVV